ncbi:glycerate kinase [uncultured Cellulomonas sp.]|uniref:glycerate kinase n=1 Tax=uncultured Cellulomonas sp. TaxID=189682 RepID=UPI00262C12E1|nr:glycerate kinase [uncultured Cellulomonas sp.]
MRVLVAPESFGGALSATQAARAIRSGWLGAAPGDDVRSVPLTDAGSGLVDVLHDVLGGELLSATVRGAQGDPAPAAVLVVTGQAGDRTAYVDAAHAVGPALVPAARRDAGRGASSGVGQLLALARATGARRVVVGVGDAATNDAGAGMLAALGAGVEVTGPLAMGGHALAGVTEEDLSGLAALRADWSGIELVAAYALDLPLLGMHGASAGATAHGASPEQAQALERSLGHFAHAAVAALGPGTVRPDLLLSARAASPAARLTALPGAGAGGGLGFGLALLGARLYPGAALVADEVGLTGRLADVDLAVTGGATVEPRSLHDAVVATVADRAMVSGVPTVVVAGEVLVGRRELAAAGITAAYPVEQGHEPGRARPGPAAGGPADAGSRPPADGAAALARRAARVARTWSR